MMDNNERIEVVRDYIANHKVNPWQLFDNEASYLIIYKDLIGGLFGDVTCINIDKTQYEIEIPARESITGKTIFFWWYDDSR